jgi:Uma2 family endonuclease
MNALAQQKMTVDEFLAWAEGRDGRWELLNGVPVAMSPERVAHVETKFAAASAIAASIKKAGIPCRMLLDGVAIRLDGRSAYQPDIMVYCGQRLPPNAMEAPNPVVVVEVLSPSTRAVDLGLKVRRYFELPSIQHYLILGPDDRSVIHHARGEGDLLLTRIVSEGELRLDPPGFRVDARALFPEPYEA